MDTLQRVRNTEWKKRACIAFRIEWRGNNVTRRRRKFDFESQFCVCALVLHAHRWFFVFVFFVTRFVMRSVVFKTLYLWLLVHSAWNRGYFLRETWSLFLAMCIYFFSFPCWDKLDWKWRKAKKGEDRIMTMIFPLPVTVVESTICHRRCCLCSRSCVLLRRRRGVWDGERRGQNEEVG